jgi:hypothetical protein
MNIQTLTDKIKEICLNHIEVKGFNIGNTWNQATGKGDIYPAVWVEMPILIEYLLKNQKTYTFSIDVLMLPKQDDCVDELFKQSQCEQIADQLLQAFKLKISNLNEGRMTGLTVKNLNADIACGVRIDMVFITNRECEPLNYFKETMERL